MLATTEGTMGYEVGVGVSALGILGILLAYAYEARQARERADLSRRAATALQHLHGIAAVTNDHLFDLQHRMRRWGEEMKAKAERCSYCGSRCADGIEQCHNCGGPRRG